jgi:hypothetical protein
VSRRYVQGRDAIVNEQIDSQLRLVTKVILKNMAKVRSIIIAGGFGKGEGSVKLTEDGKVICLRDFDIVCIVDRKPNSKVVDKLYDQIYKSLGLKNPESSLFRQQSFAVDLKFLRKEDLIYSDIYFYDLKAASQILWGEDVRPLIPWTKKDVPLSSGLRLLFEKVCGLLGNFSIAYVQGKMPTYQEKESLVSECHKTFIEIGTALCILAGKYEPKYAQRAKVLENLYATQFPELARVLPELPKKVIEYTDLRLRSYSLENYEDPVELWFSARNYLRESFNFYLKSYTGKSLSDWNALPVLMRAVAREYYKPFLGPLLRARLRFSSRFVLDLATFLYQGLTNLEYAYVVALSNAGASLRPLMRWYVSPSLKYFPAGAMLLFSLNRDATIEKDLLKSAAKELRHCIPVELFSFDASGWEELRCRFLKAHSLYRGYHLVK